MQKAKLGISVGLLGAAIYFTALFNGYLLPVILAGYVLLFEENEWLRKSAIKAVSVLIAFSLLVEALCLIPDVIGFIGDILAIFGLDFYIGFLSRIVQAIVSGLNIIKTVLFICLGLKALNQGTISVPVVDQIVEKYM